MLVRSYKPDDYEHVVKLYKQTELYGGQFDANRDSKERIQKRIENDPDAILVADDNNKILGTVSLIEDGRVAWLFRFAVMENNVEIAKALFEKAKELLSKKGHSQVLIYTPIGNKTLYERYKKLGFTKGNDYTCYWKNI